MSMTWLKNKPKTLGLLWMLLSVFISIPICFAGGAATIVQDEKQLAPRGSYIPERRVQQVLNKVQEHRAMMMEKQKMEVENQLQENEKTTSKSSDEK
jgi:hypothetical protein